MLSRIAESLFWIGRYVERAEDTSRILDSHLRLTLDDPMSDQAAATEALMAVMGCAQGAQTQEETMEVLCHDPASPSSIVASIDGVHLAARRSRETVSLEMWEAINTFWRSTQAGHLRRLRPATALAQVRERCAMIGGIANGTMVRDEGWHFYRLGRDLERVDMTARLVRLAALSPSQAAWTDALRSCGAHHAFVREYGATAGPATMAGFLLQNQVFPRSVVFNLASVQSSLTALKSHATAAPSEALRIVGLARADLLYRTPAELVAALPDRMSALQRAAAATSDSIAHQYFTGATTPRWQGE